MSGRDIGRLLGTGVLTVATAVPYAAGIWMAWAYLFSRLPMPFGIIATIGIIVAPFQLVRDILAADRSDKAAREAGQQDEIHEEVLQENHPETQ